MRIPAKDFHERSQDHVYPRSLPELPLFESDEERTWYIKKLAEVFARRTVDFGAPCFTR